jgi:hypothetical protein
MADMALALLADQERLREIGERGRDYYTRWLSLERSIGALSRSELG